MSATPTVSVLAPSMFVSVTIEDGPSDELEEIHLHPGGQGMWVARMLRHLGEVPVVCAPLGGEGGRTLVGLTQAWDGLELDVVWTEEPSPIVVDDRRSGDRVEHARSWVPALGRHDVDELYGRVLVRARETGLCVVTGRFGDTDVPTDFYRRLGADLAALGVDVVGDLHGDELDAFLEDGQLHWLKVSDGDMVEDGLLEDGDDTEEGALAALRDLVDRGADRVAMSRSGRGGLAHADGTTWRVDPPDLEAVDPDGAGDSMTAALAAALLRDADDAEAVRLAWAAGGANVIRRGHGSASADLIESLAGRVELTEVST